MDVGKIKSEQQKKIEYLKHPDPNDKKVKIIRIFIRVIGIVVFILIGSLMFFGYKNHIFDSTENFNLFIERLGTWGPVCFIILQAIQVILPILPAPVSSVGGVISYGPWIGFLYNYIGIIIGSLIAFSISKKYGSLLAKSVVSDETYEKHIKWLDKGKKFDKFFIIAILLPGAPDDFLCYLAGLTKMTLKKFMIIMLLGKPISLLSYSLGLEVFSIVKNWFS